MESLNNGNQNNTTSTQNNINTNNSHSNQSQISNNIDIHQKRLVLQDPTDPKQYLLTSIFIYCAQYYPKTKKLLNNIIDLLLTKNVKDNTQLIYNCTSNLSQDVLRQIIYGPSATFIPPIQIPHISRLDTHLQTPQFQLKKISYNDLLIAHQQLNIQTIIPKNKIRQLEWYRKSISLRNSRIVNNKYQSKQLKNQLQLQGQNWLEVTPLAGLFLVLKQTWKNTLQKIQKNNQLLYQSQKIRLLLARFSFLHNKILTNPVKQLAQDVFHHYQTYIHNMFKVQQIEDKNHEKVTIKKYIQILIQYSYCLLYYYKYKKCQRLINQCCQILQMEFQYTGKLGRRTKYQSFDCAQLILNLRKKNNEKIQESQLTQTDKKQQQQADKLIIPNAKLLVAEEIQKASKQQSTKLDNDKIKQSTYDEDNILLQRPLFVEQQGDKSQEQKFMINQHKIITALAMVNYTYCTLPQDQMRFQYIAASIQSLLANPDCLNYSIQFSILLLRSFNDFPRVKHAQRALQQLQTLKNQYDQKSTKNVSFLFSTPYVTRFEFIMKFAHRYMDIQMILTGVDLLKRAGMYEQCIDGLIQKNYKEKALQLVNQIIQQKGKTPRLLCMLGDIHHNQIKYYEQAWTLSENKYARAMRSLGWVYFSKQNYEKAAECFVFATQVNYYNPNTWFTLGCCYIRTNQFQKALRPFGQSVRIDQTQGEAWGNIASCYMHLKKMKQAYSTLQQAVKYSQGNWRIWSNLLSVSISLKQFYKFFQCIQKIVKLNHSQIITKQILNKIQMVMKYQVFEAMQGKTRKRIPYNFKRRIDKLFQFLQQSIGQNPLIWQAKAAYLQGGVILYLEQMYRFYTKAHKQGTADFNDTIDGYQTIQSTSETTQVDLSFVKQQIIQTKQTQLNMLMKIGWQQSKIECEKVLKVAKQYISIHNKYSYKSDEQTTQKKQFKLFINGLKDKLQKGLQMKIDLSIQNEKK